MALARPILSLGNMSFSMKPRPRHYDLLTLQDANKGNLRLLLAQHYKERNVNMLWRSVNSQAMRVKRVLRAKCEKRVGTALTEVLHEHGFDGHGRRLPEHLPGLKGSLEISIFKNCLSVDYEAMKEELRSVVNYIIHQNRLHQPSTREKKSR